MAEGAAGTIRHAPQPRCPACGAAGRQVHAGARDEYAGSPGEWSVSRCDGCRGLWLDPAPLPEDLGLAYLDYHTHGPGAPRGWQRHKRSLYARVLQARLRALPGWAELKAHHRQRRLMHLGDAAPGRLLDVGCGGGQLLRRMKQRGWDVVGIDFDPQATRRVQERFGIPVHTGDLRQAALEAGSFSAIVMNHAIEHIDRPDALLAECARLLQPGGRLVVITPNAQSVAHRRFGPLWRGLEVPRHLQVFSRAGLVRCAESAGFQVVRAETFSCDAEIVYRTSLEMAQRRGGRPVDPILSTRRSLLATLAEQRALARNPDCGEDVLLVARRP